jgi:hypothetical protein
MGLVVDNSSLFALTVPNVRTVQFQAATSESTLATAVNVQYAVRRAPTHEELLMYPHVGLVWHLWANQLPPGVVPKRLDVITDGAEQWKVEKVDAQAWQQRYRCLCFQENF